MMVKILQSSRNDVWGSSSCDRVIRLTQSFPPGSFPVANVNKLDNLKLVSDWQCRQFQAIYRSQLCVRQIYPFIKGNNRPSLSLLSDFHKHYDFTEIVRCCFWNIDHKIMLYYLYELQPCQSFITYINHLFKAVLCVLISQSLNVCRFVPGISRMGFLIFSQIIPRC